MIRLAPALVAVLVVVSGCQGLFDGGVSDRSDARTPTLTDSPTTKTRPSYTEASENLRWGLTLLYDNITFRERAEATIGVATEGDFNGIVYGVKIQFLNENRTVIEEIPVGNITRLGQTKWVNTTIPTIPVYVTAKMDGWNTPNMEPVRVSGQKITTGGSELYTITDPENFTY